MKSNARYNELQFITGLKHARKILLALKETKLAESNRVELKSKQENRSTEPRQQTTQANQPEDTLPTIKPIVA